MTLEWAASKKISISERGARARPVDRSPAATSGREPRTEGCPSFGWGEKQRGR